MSDSLSDPDFSQQRRRTAIMLVPGLITFSMGQTVLFAVAGPVIRDIGLSEFQLGLIVSASALVFVIFSPLWGRISDQWGRKPVIVFGLFTYAIISFAFAAVMDVGLSGVLGAFAVFLSLLGLRLLYAALGSGIQPSSVALMADLSEDKDRSSAVAIVGAAFGLGMILGPAAAAFLVGWGVLVPLYAIAGLGLISAIVALVGLKGQAPTSEKQEEEAPKVPIRPLLPIMLAGLLVFTAVSALQQTMAFYVQDYLGVDSEAATKATGICFVAMAVMTLIAQGGLIQAFKPGPNLLLMAGLPLMLIGMVCYSVPVAFWQIIVAASFLGLGFGLVNPGLVAAASLRTSAETQGAVAGIMQAVMAGGYVFGPLFGTALYERGAILSAAFVAICLTLALITLGVVALRAQSMQADHA